GRVPTEELVIEKRLSKRPNEYVNRVSQAIAAKHLVKEGADIHAGQCINFILTSRKSKMHENLALPYELTHQNMPYDSEAYTALLLSSATNLLLPFGYELETVAKMIDNRF